MRRALVAALLVAAALAAMAAAGSSGGDDRTEVACAAAQDHLDAMTAILLGGGPESLEANLAKAEAAAAIIDENAPPRVAEALDTLAPDFSQGEPEFKPEDDLDQAQAILNDWGREVCELEIRP